MYENIIKTGLKGNGQRSRTKHRFQTVWWTPAVVDQVWEALVDYASWPTWWRGIEKFEVLCSSPR